MERRHLSPDFPLLVRIFSDDQLIVGELFIIQIVLYWLRSLAVSQHITL